MKLTPRETEIVAILALEPTLGYKEVAARLTPRAQWRTVRTHVHRLARRIASDGPALKVVTAWAMKRVA